MAEKKTKAEDTRTSKNIRAEFTKALLEIQNAEFRVMHDICLVSGVIGVMRGGPDDPRRAAEKIKEHIIAKRFVKDLVFYCAWRSA